MLNNPSILLNNKEYKKISEILKNKYENVINKKNTKDIIKYLELEKEREEIAKKIFFEEGFKEGIKLLKYFL